ncbi:murein hydrolase activator EnvC family protein [Desulforamulus putei]|uniref:Peptidase family M23 n=1 Tax=Desulforamulus putei DSM 12395 TaxID=1121429 RepID=A0A1M4U9A7_9FIRM|nr:M23 family metallopeptidase [Desulforamulus putei]SHE53187.1 Peptidase family M23 [Desulforamulus putei DSM 12395]
MKIGRISLDRFKKKSRDPLSGYYNYGPDDWSSIYQSGSRWKRKKPGSKGWKTFYRVVAALGILAVLLLIKESSHPWSQQAREGLRVALTTEWDVTPVLDKAIAIGLQTVNMDWPMFNNELTGPVLPTTADPAKGDAWAVPVSGRVVQEFGWVKSPEDNLERFSPGIDISAAAGAPVKAVQPGTVSRLGHDRTYGEFVLIEHRKGEYALYAGLTEISVREGHRVQAGQVIGKVAEPTEGEPVLHFEVRENDKLVDPLKKIHLTPDQQDQESSKQ